MGYSSEAILIKPQLNKEEYTAILTLLGFNGFQFNKEANFDEADTRRSYGVYFGNCNGATILIYNGMFFKMRKENFLPFEETLTDHFPDKEFLSIYNVESANAYLYHYFKNHETIRLKEGDSDMVRHNVGKELELEKAYYVKKEIRDGDEIFYTKSWNNESVLEEWTHDQIGGSVAFALAKMFTGVDYTHDDIFYSKFSQFIPTASVEKLIEFYNSKKTLEELKIDHTLRSFFPTSRYKTIIEQIEPFLKENGFNKAQEEYIFKKENNGLTHVIDFKSYNAGLLITEPQFRYYITTPYPTWYKETFGQERDFNDQILHPELRLSAKEVGIEDNYKDIFEAGSKKDISSIVINIEAKLRKVVIPYFEKISNFNDVAQYSYFLYKVDFYIMAQNFAEAETALNNAFDVLIKESIKKKWNEEILTNWISEFQNRGKLLNVPYQFLDIYNEKKNHPNYAEQETPLPEDEEEETPKITENEDNEYKKHMALYSLLHYRKKKAWWQFWKKN